jgi:putative flippase GtrA
VILRFILVGGLGFVVDLGFTTFLIWSGVSPFYARPPAIAIATLVTWLANRTFTFDVKEGKSAGEAMRYALTALAAAAVNYAIYSLLVWKHCPPSLAIAIASVLQACASYVGYRKFAFRIDTRK